MKKKNILFLNGWMENSNTWDLVIENLKNEFNCITLEFPGFGVSEVPDEIWDINDYAIWVRGEIEKLGIGDFYLVGHSFGGRVAIVLSTLDSRIEKLILYGTPGFKEPQSKRMSVLMSANNLALKMGIDREKIPFAKKLKEKISSEDYKSSGEMSKIFKSAINFDLLPFMDKITCSTLIIMGEKDDQVSLETARKMLLKIQGSKLKVIPGSGHFAHLENPNLFCGIIRKFVDEKDI